VLRAHHLPLPLRVGHNTRWVSNYENLPGAVGAVLAQAAAPGAEAIAVLKRETQAELQALLDALEPVDDGPYLGPGR